MVISFVVFVLTFNGRFSIAIITTPPKIKASDTYSGENKYALIAL